MLIARAFIFADAYAFAQGNSTQYQIKIDPAAHHTYGLYYPITYVFQLPSGLSDLGAQYRYDVADAWIDLPTMTAADRFNGVPAARFDYENFKSYIGVPFSSVSDVIFLRIIQGTNEIAVGYLGISAYYDNRRAAVTVSLDDWHAGSGQSFADASLVLSSAHVPDTVGINTYGSPDWSRIQSWYDAGIWNRHPTLAIIRAAHLNI